MASDLNHLLTPTEKGVETFNCWSKSTSEGSACVISLLFFFFFLQE